MAKRGPKGTDKKTKENQGTYQPCRERKEYYPAVGDNSNLVCPNWLVDRFGDKIKRFWDWKVEIYNLRGQPIVGMEDQFAMLCAMHGQIVEFYDICLLYDVPNDDYILGGLFSYLEEEDTDGLIDNDMYAIPLDDFFKQFKLLQFPDYNTCIDFCESSR